MKHFITAVMLLFVSGPVSAQNFELEKLFPQVECMALNIYYESRGSNLADKAAVADVVLNRVNDTRYPDTVCGVVKQGLQDANGNMLRNKCQFSWYCDGKHDRPQDEDRWVEAQSIAWNMVEENKYRGITEGSTHYHATYVNPRWAKTLQLVGRIGAHMFYRWE
jgi:spore germination cell wall hydrolase CwlJ-like protein